jgi:DNA-binding transcriptional ArsR family regulator
LHDEAVLVDPFEVLAQPVRRSLLDRLRTGEHLVGELAEALALPQPVTSKHLRVLREAGLVAVRIDGPRRWYRLQPAPLAVVADWLEPYRWLWSSSLDRLGDHLDVMEEHDA